MDIKKKLLVIVGPTASGKTAVAYEISKILSVEMISCDSMQIYKSMPIITQAPSKRVTMKLKTHLVSFLDPSKEYSAAHFRKDALSLLLKIMKRKKIPMIVGGAGLYLKALLDGLFESEGTKLAKDDAFRRKLLSEQAANSGNYLHEKLKAVDALSAKKIHPNDLRRIVRALEVFYLTQRPLSEQKPNRKGIREEWDCRIFLLDRDREELYGQINRRVDRMIKGGLIAEVKKLNKKKLSQTAQMALGIREMSQCLSGSLTLVEAAEHLKRNTRHYAKRQLSWFRHEKGVERVPVRSGDMPAVIAAKILKSWVSNA